MTAEYEDLFRRLATETDRAAAGDFGLPEISEAEPIEVTGADPDDLIRVTMSNGSVTSVEILPHALRQGNAEVADMVRAAVNAALEANLAKVMEQMTGEETDFGKLQKSLKEIQGDAIRSMNAYTDGMLEMLKQVKSL